MRINQNNTLNLLLFIFVILSVFIAQVETAFTIEKIIPHDNIDTLWCVVNGIQTNIIHQV